MDLEPEVWPSAANFGVANPLDPDKVTPFPCPTPATAESARHETRYAVACALLDGKRALITGGDSGIGRAVAVAFAKEGADIAIAYLEEHDDAKHTASLVQDVGRRCLQLPGDLAVAEQCRAVVARTADELGGLDILVNNVAYQNPAENFTDISDAQWRRTFAVNIDSFFRVTKAALEHIPDGGAIINTGSINGMRGNKTLEDDSATKGAVIALTYSLAQSLSDRRVRVNCVAPGPVWTPLIPATMDADHVEFFRRPHTVRTGRSARRDSAVVCVLRR